MAQDMVLEAQQVFAPTEPAERIQIRVGIHVGLGQNVPKFSVYGDAVNIAARMEKTAPVNKVHVSEAFHDLLGENTEVRWEKKEDNSYQEYWGTNDLDAESNVDIK